MKKRFLLVVLVLFILVGCSSVNNTPVDLDEFYDLFASVDFDNVTIETTDYNNNVVSSTKTMKIDGDNFYELYVRDETYYSVNGYDLTTYTAVGSNWFYETKEAETFINRNLTMSSFFNNMLPNVEVEDYDNNSNVYTYEKSTSTTFFETVIIYTITFNEDYIEIVNTQTIVNSDGDSTTETIKKTKLNDFGTTKVELPENAEKL